MDIAPDLPPEDAAVDPALVEAMRERVVRRKVQDYGNRKAGPGRPKGSTKPAGSGKMAGTPNVLTPEFRQWLHDKAKPFELLADICTGKVIQDGETRRKPTVAERMRAAETLARKLLPDLAATAITGSDGGPVAFTGDSLSPFELARRVAFALANGVAAAEAEARHPAPFLPPARDDDSEVDGVQTIALPDRSDWTVCGLSIIFAEPLGANRERWVIRDQSGRIVGSAIGRDAASAMARRIGGGE